MSTGPSESPSTGVPLPEELIYEIVGYLSREDQLACSLLSRIWRWPSQTEAFRTFNMNGSCVKKWLSNPDDESQELLMNWVHLLSCRIGREPASYPLYQRFSREYLHKFVKLTSLHLTSAHLDSRFQFIQASQPQIKVLTLEDCDTTPCEFVTLLNRLPELTHLKLINVRHIKGRRPPSLPRLPPSLRKLSVVELRRESIPLLMILFSVKWFEVSISRSEKGSWPIPGYVIQGVSESVTSLDLQENMTTLGFGLDFSKCTELRELKICGDHPQDEEINILSTVTSMKIRRIIFTRSMALHLRAGTPYWKNLDSVLCGLANRLGYTEELQVEIQLTNSPQAYCTINNEDEYLPLFCEHSQGRVKFMDQEGKVIHFGRKQW